MPTTTIRSLDLRVGDIIEYRGQLHEVTHVDCHNGWAWPVAFDDAGWAIAVGSEVVVLRAVAETPPAANGDAPPQAAPTIGRAADLPDPAPIG